MREGRLKSLVDLELYTNDDRPFHSMATYQPVPWQTRQSCHSMPFQFPFSVAQVILQFSVNLTTLDSSHYSAMDKQFSHIIRHSSSNELFSCLDQSGQGTRLEKVYHRHLDTTGFFTVTIYRRSQIISFRCILRSSNPYMGVPS